MALIFMVFSQFSKAKDECRILLQLKNRPVTAENWQQVIGEIHQKYSFLEPAQTEKSAGLKVYESVFDNIDSPWFDRLPSRYTNTALREFFQIENPYMNGLQIELAIEVVRLAEKVGLKPLVKFSYGGPGHGSGRFDRLKPRERLDFISSGGMIYGASWQESMPPEGYVNPFFHVMQASVGGNSLITIVMDGEGRPFILKDSVVDAGDAVREEQVMRKAFESGIDFVIQTIYGAPTDQMRLSREFVYSESNIGQVLQNVETAHKLTKSKESLVDLIRVYLASYKAAEILAEAGILIQYDFSLDEMLVAKEEGRWVVKIVDFGGSGGTRYTSADELKQMGKWSCLKYNLHKIKASLNAGRAFTDRFVTNTISEIIEPKINPTALASATRFARLLVAEQIAEHFGNSCKGDID